MKKQILLVATILSSISASAQSWTDLGNDGLQAAHEILTLELDDSGNLYAGGAFTNTQGNPYVAKWDGTSWSELGGANSMHGNLEIYTILDMGAGHVAAAGNFHDSDFNQFVDFYNSGSWSQLGSDFVGQIYELAKDGNGNVYAVGEFGNTDGSYYVGKWNGSSWTALGGQFSFPGMGATRSVATDAAGNVYVAGHFSNAGGGGGGIAKFDGTSWSFLSGTTLNDGTDVVRVDGNGNVYTTGLFGNSAGNYYIAKWNGTDWVEVGGNNALAANDEIEDFQFDDAGNIYAGGGFTNGTGVYVAKFNGTSWSNVSTDAFSALNGYIASIAVTPDGHDIYASGDCNNIHGHNFVGHLAQQVPLGLEENSAITVTAYPNPVVSQLSLKGATNGEYTIASVNGKLVQGGTFGQNPIAVDQLETGVYILTLNDKTAGQQVLRFTKTSH